MSDDGIVITELGGNCPVQAEGTIDGKEFYFRARGEHWSLRIGGADVVGNPDWSYEEEYGREPFVAGWMTEDEARLFIVGGAALFRKTQCAPSEERSDDALPAAGSQPDTPNIA